MELSEKTVKKNYVYNGRIINVRCDEAELPDGRPCSREVVEHHGGVCIAPRLLALCQTVQISLYEGRA